MYATTGTEEKNTKIETFYFIEKEKDRKTVRSFTKNEILFLTNPPDDLTDGKYKESVSESRKSVIIIPISEPQSPHVKKDKVRNIGVLRVVNKILTKDGIIKYGTFSWEDVCILEYAVEMIGVIAFLYKKNTEKR